jgi:hypothetical protein
MEYINEEYLAYKRVLDWNRAGFAEVDRILDQMKDFADEYNNMGKFRFKIKDTAENKRMILVIELEK